MLRLPSGSPLLSPPWEGFAVRWTRPDPLLVPASIPVGASLATEDDFELGGEFLDVFLRPAERLLGFFAGCLAVAAIWMISSML